MNMTPESTQGFDPDNHQHQFEEALNQEKPDTHGKIVQRGLKAERTNSWFRSLDTVFDEYRDQMMEKGTGKIGRQELAMLFNKIAAYLGQDRSKKISKKEKKMLLDYFLNPMLKSMSQKRRTLNIQHPETIFVAGQDTITHKADAIFHEPTNENQNPNEPDPFVTTFAYGKVREEDSQETNYLIDLFYQAPPQNITAEAVYRVQNQGITVLPIQLFPANQETGEFTPLTEIPKVNATLEIINNGLTSPELQNRYLQDPLVMAYLNFLREVQYREEGLEEKYAKDRAHRESYQADNLDLTKTYDLLPTPLIKGVENMVDLEEADPYLAKAFWAKVHYFYRQNNKREEPVALTLREIKEFINYEEPAKAEEGAEAEAPKKIPLLDATIKLGAKQLMDTAGINIQQALQKSGQNLIENQERSYFSKEAEENIKAAEDADQASGGWLYRKMRWFGRKIGKVVGLSKEYGFFDTFERMILKFPWLAKVADNRTLHINNLKHFGFRKWFKLFGVRMITPEKLEYALTLYMASSKQKLQDLNDIRSILTALLDRSSGASIIKNASVDELHIYRNFLYCVNTAIARHRTKEYLKDIAERRTGDVTKDAIKFLGSNLGNYDEMARESKERVRERDEGRAEYNALFNLTDQQLGQLYFALSKAFRSNVRAGKYTWRQFPNFLEDQKVLVRKGKGAKSEMKIALLNFAGDLKTFSNFVRARCYLRSKGDRMWAVWATILRTMDIIVSSSSKISVPLKLAYGALRSFAKKKEEKNKAETNSKEHEPSDDGKLLETTAKHLGIDVTAKPHQPPKEPEIGETEQRTNFNLIGNESVDQEDETSPRNKIHLH